MHAAEIQLALDWHAAGRGAALATVIETWGSAPRGVGSQLVIDASGEMQGSVSGGCVEGAVILEAQEALADGKSRLLTYGVSDDDAFAVGLACGGTIRVLVEPVGTALDPDVLKHVVTAAKARIPTGWQVPLDGGPHQLLAHDMAPQNVALDRSGLSADGEKFTLVINPPLRMLIIGAVHITQPLVQMAALSGIDPTIIDPRPAFATQARFPGHTLVDAWPDEALGGLGIDSSTAIIALTHDPKIDDPALIAALGSKAFYIGALGSTRTHAKRVERLAQMGLSDDQIARIHAPVGLDLGGRKPAEIAVSILAQVIQSLRKSPPKQ